MFRPRCAVALVTFAAALLILLIATGSTQRQLDGLVVSQSQSTSPESVEPVRKEADTASEPIGLFLTWRSDPTTTAVIDWHASADSSRTLEFKPFGDETWQAYEAQLHEFPNSERTIFRVELSDLSPGTAYRFRPGDYSRQYYFRTLPTDIQREPLVFAVGGDVRHSQAMMERTNRVAMAYDPDFIVWGGDLAYADGNLRRVGRWYEWFDAIRNTLISDEGRVVPIVLGIGNHEVQRGYIHGHAEYEQSDEFREQIAPFFYSLFAFPGQPGYGVLDVADYLSLVILDTDHSNPVDGTQTEWLAEVLAEREAQRVPHVLPVYHVPAYPSHRAYNGRVSRRVREHWVPLFERHGVRVAFEHHDHTYKRTHAIRGGEIAADGVVYLGDGAWGVGTRTGESRDEWYINRFASERHTIIATLHGTHQHFMMVSEHGDVMDEFPQTPRHRRATE